MKRVSVLLKCGLAELILSCIPSGCEACGIPSGPRTALFERGGGHEGKLLICIQRQSRSLTLYVQKAQKLMEEDDDDDREDDDDDDDEAKDDVLPAPKVNGASGSHHA